ncbi:MAG: hypothetical protein IJE70_00300 [Oscillospiraceae bacterium]|nr:hypothetical protein [Oscillospiraceae bacterium]
MSFNDLFKPEEQENPLFKTVPKTFTQTVTTNILKNTSNKNSGNPYRTSYTGTNLGMGDSTYAPKTTNPSPPKSYTASETKKKDLFLEGFYSVADKPKEERRSYNPSPYAKSRAMLDSMTQAKREEEDDFLKGFYSVADRPKEETPTSAYLQTIRQNMQTAYKPGDWLRSTMTKPNLWNAKNTDLSPQKVNYASNINARTGENRDEYDSRIRQQYAARRQAEEDAKSILSTQQKQVPTVYLHAKQQVPTVYFHATPEPLQSGTEDDFKSFSHLSEGGVINAANQKADEIINDAFRLKRNWFYDSYTDGTSPYDVSELKNAEYKVKKAESLSELETLARNIISKGIEYKIGVLSGEKPISKKDLGTILSEIPKQLFEDYVEEQVIKTRGVDDLINSVAPKITLQGLKNAQDYYEYINESNSKYLVKGKRERELFVSRLRDELDKIEKTEKFGFLPQEDSNNFKKVLIDRLKNIIFLNENYEYQMQNANEKWQQIKSSYTRK